MRVTKDRDTSAAPRTDASYSHSRSKLILQVGLLILALVLGFVIHREGWHRPLVAFVQRPSFTATALLHRSNLPTLYVDLRFADYQRLGEKRDQAFHLGVNIATDQDYVPATMSTADGAVAVQMRLLEGPTVALKGDAWPFDVTIEDDGALFDLRRFTLVPADEAVLSMWGYLETLRQAGILSPRHYLVHLVWNGRPLGLYALEERLTVESLAAQGRPQSVIASFDRSAYWEAYARLEDALPGSGFQYAQVAVDCASSPPDAACDDAARRLLALQAGEGVPSDAFDADKMGMFLALTTLWRGTSELDWRTLRLAYDPVTARFEPIGTGDVLTPIAPLPDAFTDDPLIQVAYVRALAQLSHPDYLTQLQDDLGDDLEALRQALGADIGYLELPWPTLEAHQAVMRRQIAPSRTLFAIVEADDAALVLRLSNVQPFPVEIVSLDIGEDAFLTVDPAWVTESDRDSLVDASDGVILRAAVASTPRTVRLRVPPEALPAGHEWVIQSPDQVRIVTRLFGLTGRNIVVIASYDDPASLSDTGGRSP